MTDPGLEQSVFLAQLSIKEAHRLFKTVMATYDQPFSILSLNRKENYVEVAIELENGERRTIKL